MSSSDKRPSGLASAAKAFITPSAMRTPSAMKKLSSGYFQITGGTYSHTTQLKRGDAISVHHGKLLGLEDEQLYIVTGILEGKHRWLYILTKPKFKKGGFVSVFTLDNYILDKRKDVVEVLR